jgi:hypothetical protein
MALSLDIWIDRVRVYRTVPGARVEGETRANRTRSEWISARVPPREAAESVNGERPKKVQDIREITCSLLDPDGKRIEIKKSDRIEVETGYQGSYTELGMWDVLSNQIPRGRDGEELLQYLRILKVEEY